MFCFTRASVSFARVSASGRDRSTRIRATLSLGTARSFSPAASSVVSISESATDIHASSGRPARLRNPSTAIARRGARTAAGPPPSEREYRARRRGKIRPAATATSTAATAITIRRRRPRAERGLAGTCSPRSAPADVERGREAVRGIALEAPQDRAVPRGRQVGRRSPRRGRRLLELLQRDRQRRVAVERLAAGDHLVEDDAERVDVGRGRQGAALDLLGRHVVRRAEHGLRLRQRRPARRLRAAREAEVGDDDPHAARPPLVGREHDVAALEVAVDHAGVVRGGERRGHLLDQRQRVRRPHPAGALEALGERLAGEQLHREEREVLVVEDVVDPAHVRVRHRAREVDLPQEPVHRPRIARDLRPDRLERDPLVEDLVLGLVDLAHAAARDEAHDAESSREDLVDRDARAARGPAARHDRRLILGTRLGQGVEPPERPEELPVGGRRGRGVPSVMRLRSVQEAGPRGMCTGSLRLHSRADDPLPPPPLALVDRSHLLCARAGRALRPSSPAETHPAAYETLPLHVEGLHQPDQDADRPADLLDHRRRDRQDRRHQGGRPDGGQGDHLLRDRHDGRARARPRDRARRPARATG